MSECISISKLRNTVFIQLLEAVTYRSVLKEGKWLKARLPIKPISIYFIANVNVM